MIDLDTLDDKDEVLVTIHADNAAVPARPTVNGREIIILNEQPTVVPVPFARVLKNAGYNFTLSNVERTDGAPEAGDETVEIREEPTGEAHDDDGVVDAEPSKPRTFDNPLDPLNHPEGTKAHDSDSADAPPVLGGDGAGGSAQPQGDSSAAPIPEESDAADEAAFDPSPLLDANIETVKERLGGLSKRELLRLKAAEEKGKTRKGVIEAIDARLLA